MANTTDVCTKAGADPGIFDGGGGGGVGGGGGGSGRTV